MSPNTTCIVHRCRKQGGFIFPVKEDIKSKWLKAIKWAIPLEPKKTAVVCPDHFTQNDFDFDDVDGHSANHLKSDAVPSLFPWNSDLWGNEESSTDPSDDEDSSSAEYCGSGSEEVNDDSSGEQSLSPETQNSIQGVPSEVTLRPSSENHSSSGNATTRNDRGPNSSSSILNPESTPSRSSPKPKKKRRKKNLDESATATGKQIKRRPNVTKFTEEQKVKLEQIFQKNNFPCRMEKEEIYRSLGLRNVAVVKNWFQNRRALFRKYSREKLGDAAQLAKKESDAHSRTPSAEDSEVESAIPNGKAHPETPAQSAIRMVPDGEAHRQMPVKSAIPDGEALSELPAQSTKLDIEDHPETPVQSAIKDGEAHPETPAHFAKADSKVHSETPSQSDKSHSEGHPEAPPRCAKSDSEGNPETPAQSAIPDSKAHPETPAQSAILDVEAHSETPSQSAKSDSEGHPETPAQSAIPDGEGHPEAPPWSAKSDSEGHPETPAQSAIPNSKAHPGTPAQAAKSDSEGHPQTPPRSAKSDSEGHLQTPPRSAKSDSEGHQEKPPRSAKSDSKGHPETPAQSAIPDGKARPETPSQSTKSDSEGHAETLALSAKSDNEGHAETLAWSAKSDNEGHPETPAQSAKSDVEARSETPAQSAKSDVEARPETPAQSAKSDIEAHLETPAQSARSDVESLPETPAMSAKSDSEGHPDTPAESAKSDSEGHSVTPPWSAISDNEGHPETPAQSAKSDIEAHPETPAHSTRSDVESLPETPAKSAKSDSEGHPGTPAQSAKSDSEGHSVTPAKSAKSDSEGHPGTPAQSAKSDSEGHSVTPAKSAKSDREAHPGTPALSAKLNNKAHQETPANEVPRGTSSQSDAETQQRLQTLWMYYGIQGCEIPDGPVLKEIATECRLSEEATVQWFMYAKRRFSTRKCKQNIATKLLLKKFIRNCYPSDVDINDMSYTTGMSPEEIQNWFRTERYWQTMYFNEDEGNRTSQEDPPDQVPQPVSKKRKQTPIPLTSDESNLSSTTVCSSESSSHYTDQSRNDDEIDGDYVSTLGEEAPEIDLTRDESPQPEPSSPLWSNSSSSSDIHLPSLDTESSSHVGIQEWVDKLLKRRTYRHTKPISEEDENVEIVNLLKESLQAQTKDERGKISLKGKDEDAARSSSSDCEIIEPELQTIEIDSDDDGPPPPKKGKPPAESKPPAKATPAIRRSRKQNLVPTNDSSNLQFSEAEQWECLLKRNGPVKPGSVIKTAANGTYKVVAVKGSQNAVNLTKMVVLKVREFEQRGQDNVKVLQKVVFPPRKQALNQSEEVKKNPRAKQLETPVGYVPLSNQLKTAVIRKAELGKINASVELDGNQPKLNFVQPKTKLKRPFQMDESPKQVTSHVEPASKAPKVKPPAESLSRASTSKDDEQMDTSHITVGVSKNGHSRRPTGNCVPATGYLGDTTKSQNGQNIGIYYPAKDIIQPRAPKSEPPAKRAANLILVGPEEPSTRNPKKTETSPLSGTPVEADQALLSYPNLVPEVDNLKVGKYGNKVVKLKITSGSIDGHCRWLESKMKMVDFSDRPLFKYKTLFLPEMQHGLIYWGHCPTSKTIFKLQKTIIGKIMGEDSAKGQHFSTLKLLTMPSLYILQCLVHVHKNLGKIQADILKVKAKKSKLNQKLPPHELNGFMLYKKLPVEMRSMRTDVFITVLNVFLQKHPLLNIGAYFVAVKSLGSNANTQKTPESSQQSTTLLKCN